MMEMDKRIIDLWADIGSKKYWRGFLIRNDRRFVTTRLSSPPVFTEHRFVPFKKRWPQPGFVGEEYFASPTKTVVMGQNPRATNNPIDQVSDMEMFRLIRSHSENRSSESLAELFSMMKKFMRGIEYGSAWEPVTIAEKDFCLNLNEIAYLNLIPLATYGNKIPPKSQEVFEMSTKRQLEILNPDKILVYGKGAYDKFDEWEHGTWNVLGIYQEGYLGRESISEDKRRNYYRDVSVEWGNGLTGGAFEIDKYRG